MEHLDRDLDQYTTNIDLRQKTLLHLQGQICQGSLDDTKLRAFYEQAGSYLSSSGNTKIKDSVEFLASFVKALPDILKTDNAKLFERALKLIPSLEASLPFHRAAVKAIPVPRECLTVSLRILGHLPMFLALIFRQDEPPSDVLLDWVDEMIDTWPSNEIDWDFLFGKKAVLGRLNVNDLARDVNDLDSGGRRMSKIIFKYLTSEEEWPQKTLDLVFSDETPDAIRKSVIARLQRICRENLQNVHPRDEQIKGQLYLKEKLSTHPIILRKLVWEIAQFSQDPLNPLLDLRIMIFSDLRYFVSTNAGSRADEREKGLQLLLLGATTYTNPASQMKERNFYLEMFRRCPLSITEIDRNGATDVAANYHRLREWGVRFDPEIENALHPKDACAISLEDLQKFPTIPTSLIEASEEVFQIATSAGEMFDVHDNRLNVLRGAPIHEEMLRALDKSQELFQRHATLETSGKKPRYIFRGVRSTNLSSLQLDLDTVTFATWKVKKALQYALRSSTTYRENQNDTTPVKSILMVIQCYSEMPIIRTKYSEEIVLPRNTQLYPMRMKPCHLVDWGDGYNPLLVVFYQLLPTKRKRLLKEVE